MKENNSYQLFYVHLPSCGGTTFWSILRDIYGKKKVIRCVKAEAHRDHFAAIKNAQDRFATKTVIGGHIHFRLARHKCPERRMITFLREPVDRATSVYYRKIRNGKWRPSAKRGKHDVVAFWEKEARKLQLTKYLVSSWSNEISSDSSRSSPASIIEDITDVLENRFACFGIMEHFNRSLFLFRDTFNWNSVPTYDQRNIGGNRPFEIDPGVREALEDVLQNDCRVYRFALQLFEERWQRTPSIERVSELEAFEKLLEKRRRRLLKANDGQSPYVKIQKNN